jgi:serine carboxypeptidase 1
MTDLKVVIYNGQLDLICNTLGTENWVDTLKWPHMQDFFNSTRIPLMDKTTGETQGFVKRFKNFSFFWILKAGHMVPEDAGVTALKVLDMVTKV